MPLNTTESDSKPGEDELETQTLEARNDPGKKKT